MRKPVFSHVKFHFRRFIVHKIVKQLLLFLAVFIDFLILKEIKNQNPAGLNPPPHHRHTPQWGSCTYPAFPWYLSFYCPP